MALTKAEIAEQLYEELGLNKREAKEFVEVFFGEISEILVSGFDVKISGFGNFILIKRLDSNIKHSVKISAIGLVSNERY